MPDAETIVVYGSKNTGFIRVKYEGVKDTKSLASRNHLAYPSVGYQLYIELTGGTNKDANNGADQIHRTA